MKQVYKTLLQVSESVGLRIDLFTKSGNLLFSSEEHELDYKFNCPSESAFCGGIMQDIENDITYFKTAQDKYDVVGVIQGSNKVSRNYASIIIQLLVTAFSTKEIVQEKTAIEKLRLYMCDKLDDKGFETIRNIFFVDNIEYYVVTIHISKRGDQSIIVDFLQAIKESEDILIPIDGSTICYVKEVGSDGDYSSAVEFGTILQSNIFEETRKKFVVSVGGNVNDFVSLKDSFEKALFAYEMGKKVGSNASLFTYKEYAVLKLFAKLPKQDIIEYMETLLDDNVMNLFNNDELFMTAETFLACSLNVSETSRVMYIHRNTLNYRLDKIESLSGLNIRNFNDAMTFKMATLVMKYVTK